MGFSGTAGPQLAKVKVIFHQRQHTGKQQPFFPLGQLIRLHPDGTKHDRHPLFLGEDLAPLLQLCDINMRHLNGGQLANMDGRNHFFFLIVLIFQLHNAPYATAEQTVIFRGIVLRNGDVFNAEIGKLGFVAIPPNI